MGRIHQLTPDNFRDLHCITTWKKPCSREVILLNFFNIVIAFHCALPTVKPGWVNTSKVLAPASSPEVMVVFSLPECLVAVCININIAR